MTGPSVFSRLLQLVCNCFESYSAVLFLPAPDGSCVLADSFSLGDNLRQGMELVPGQGLAGWILREKKPLLVSNFDQKRGVLGYYSGVAEEQIKAFLGVPLPGVAGVLCIDSKKVHGFGDRDQRLLSEFAGLAAALYLERVPLAGGHAEARQSQCLRQVSDLPRQYPKWGEYSAELLAQVSRASGFSHCFLAVRDDQAGVFLIEATSRALHGGAVAAVEGYALGAGMIGWVFKNDAPVYSEDADTTSVRLFGAPGAAPVFKSVICQPVSFSKRTRAVLVLASQEQEPVATALKEFVRTIADQLALFLENLHLRAQLARHKP